MSNLTSIHNHIKLLKQLEAAFGSIESDLKAWDEAWKAFYLVTPFSTCIQMHQLLTLFDLCLQTWRRVRSDGEGLAADFASWESRSDWDSESHHVWAKSILFQLKGLLVAADSQLSLAKRLSDLQTGLLRNCHRHLLSVNTASYLWFWSRPATLSKRRQFDYASNNLNQQFLVIESCSEGLVGFWREVEAYLQNIRTGRLQLQQSLILVLTPAWLDCSDVYAEVVPDHLLFAQRLQLSVDYLQPLPKFRLQRSSPSKFVLSHREPHGNEVLQAEDPPVHPKPGPLPSDISRYAMPLSDILFRRNQELRFLVRSLKWVNTAVESRWLATPQEVRLIQEDLRFVLLLLLHDAEVFVKDFLVVFEKLLSENNLTDENARDTVSRLHHSFTRTSTTLQSAAVLVEAASELLAHSITCQLERAESSTRGLGAMVVWIKLNWYRLWSLQPTAYSAYFNNRVLPLTFSTTGLPQDELAKERMGKWMTDLRQSQDRLWSLAYALDGYISRTVQEMVRSAKRDDVGSSQVRTIFQENVEEFKLQVVELTAVRKAFEEDADFLKGEYKPAPMVNWARMRPEIRRVRLW